MIYPLFIFEALKEGFVGILLTLDTLIYSLISSSFKVFMAIAGARLLSSDVYFEIANKIYIIVGVLMLFVLSYAILKGIVDPDNATKGDFGPKMIKNVVIAVIGLAVSPVLFNWMYQAQGLILEQDVLGKIFFRIENTDKIVTSGSVDVGDETINVNTEVNPDEYVKSIGGAVTAVSLWQAFFYPAEDSGKDASEIIASADGYFLSAAGYGTLCVGLGVGTAVAAGIPVVGWMIAPLVGGAAIASCAASVMNTYSGIQANARLDGGEISLRDAYSLASAGEGFGIFTVFLKNYADDGEISYLFGISTIAGAFALYAFVSFSIDMGVRAAKLAYLQIIAPVPLVMQVIPKYKKSFDNYLGIVASTFMEVFVRISVVYVVVYIICHLTDLFSSASLWGNDELNIAERLFALAFLILGLIAFCRKAPDFVTNSLGIKKGDMHLGIGKKLADGGAYVAGGIAGGGITAGVQRWRGAEGKNPAMRALSALGAMTSGAARATYGNFGPGHKPADTFRQARDIAANAAQGVTDAQEKRDARVKRHDAAREALAAARREQRSALADYTAKENALLAAQASGDQAAIAAAQQAYDVAKASLEAADKAVADARKEAQATSAIGSALNTAGRRIDAWSTGTVSTVEEEAAVKFGDSLDGLIAKTRAEAYKKDNMSPNGAGTLNKQYEMLKNQPLREYVEGWDEQSYNAEYRHRQEELNKYKNHAGIQSGLAAVSAAKARRDSAQRNFDTIKNSGIAETDQRYLSAKAALDAENATLESETTSLESMVKTTTGITAKVGVNGQLQLDMSDIKLDPAQARAERARELEGLRMAMEAAADAWVQEQASSTEMNNTKRDIQLFVSEQAAYMNEHQNDLIVTGYDSAGQPIKEVLSAVISRGFGGSAVTKGKFEPDATFKQQSTIEIEVPGRTPGTKDKITYKLEGDSYVPYDANNQRVNSTDYPTYSKDKFFEGIRSGITAGKISKASSKSAIARVGDIGKTSSTYVKTHDLADKKLKQRQVQENKGGKK